MLFVVLLDLFVSDRSFGRLQRGFVIIFLVVEMEVPKVNLVRVAKTGIQVSRFKRERVLHALPIAVEKFLGIFGRRGIFDLCHVAEGIDFQEFNFDLSTISLVQCPEVTREDDVCRAAGAETME